MGSSQSLLTVGAAVAGGFAVVLGVTSVIGVATGNPSDAFHVVVDVAMTAMWLAIGSWLLFGFVRTRSVRVWVGTLRIVGALFLLLAATTTYGNLDGYLDYSNWFAMVGLLVAAGAGSLVAASRDSAKQRVADTGSRRP